MNESSWYVFWYQYVESEATSRSKHEYVLILKKEILDRDFFIICEQLQISCLGSVNTGPI